jgi:pyridoxine 5-phosphate synthase
MSIADAVRRLSGAGIRVSLFIAADPAQIEVSKSVGAPVIEIHTGAWCEALLDERERDAAREFERIRSAATFAKSLGLEVHAGHGLDYASAQTIAGLPEIVELNIGHFLIGEAVFVGLDNAIRTMRRAMDRGRRKGAAA